MTAQKGCSDGTSRQSTISKQVTVIPNTPPVADFTANPSSGNATLTVQFTDMSSSNTLSWSWQFGDGATSTQQNPVHDYTTAGNYTATLTVCNNCGCNLKSVPITVISVCPTGNCVPIPCPVEPCPTWFPTVTPTVPTTIPTTIPTTTYPTTSQTTYPTTSQTTYPTTSPTIYPTTYPTTTVPTTSPTAVPELPHSFYGGIEVNGAPAAAGTIITAAATGGGGSITTTESGMYGGLEWDRIQTARPGID